MPENGAATAPETWWRQPAPQQPAWPNLAGQQQAREALPVASPVVPAADRAISPYAQDVRHVPVAATSWHSIAARLARTIVVVSAASDCDCHGMTADSFTLVSQEPSLVMVAVAAGGRTHRLLASAVGFGVSVLAEEQADVATHFASRRRAPGFRQFDVVSWETAPRSGAPVLTEALAWLDCERRDVILTGDHVLVIGEVVEARTRTGPGMPLVRCERQYQSLRPWARDGL